jgi:hypothetical protein
MWNLWSVLENLQRKGLLAVIAESLHDFFKPPRHHHTQQRRLLAFVVVHVGVPFLLAALHECIDVSLQGVHFAANMLKLLSRRYNVIKQKQMHAKIDMSSLGVLVCLHAL